MATNRDIADQFFTATAGGDIQLLRDTCATDFSGSQNGGPAMPIDALAGFTTTVLKLVSNFHYENRLVSETQTGFVEEHDVVADLPDGSVLRLPACIVAETAGGKVTSLREYFDSAAAKGLLKLLAGAARER